MPTFVFKIARKRRYHSEIILLKYKTDLPTQNSETLDPERKTSTSNKTEIITVKSINGIATPLCQSECLRKYPDCLKYE